ncbi:FAD dependent oxidoreductase [Paenibacillus sp. GSMTC-2017]|uniref:NAD(P)/FAD-dependent oxidoreductase n=1 Tax=Paenibacillus sp. GSMTC-2017 TaxID=2794350 RepID=UPI0018DA0F1C|nr:FAD dependent oxidoreductase [Paenibacillus sp. GSMTC-2017]MBH5316383.1 FAD dependent oxidoreductase [Paenibacillus sp. GSMTC-2017]
MNNQTSKTKIGTKALVMGGSVAGLLAARVLSNYFEEVVIIEKDELPDSPTNRPGTPQAYHPHRVLLRGKMIVERLFPGYTEDLLAEGAYLREGKTIQLNYRYGSIIIPDERDVGCSRALFEWVIRNRVRVLPNVKIISGCEVSKLEMSVDDNGQKRITGVQLRERKAPGPEQPVTIQAELVVDASGRNSKLGKWLIQLGYEVPEPERLKVSLGYSTCHFNVPEHLKDKWSTILVEGHPAKGIGTGVFSPIENNLAEVLIFRAGGQSYPSVKSEDYVREAETLLDSTISELLKQMEPVASPRGFRVAECIRHRYDQMQNWPSGLLVIGDALCNFDPIYGQGMTVAAIEAEILDLCLQNHLNGNKVAFERNVLEKMQEAIEPAWWLSAASDLQWPGVEYSGGYSMEGFKFVQRFFDEYLTQAIGKQNIEMFETYMIMTSLLIAPKEILNVEKILSVLNEATTEEGLELRLEYSGEAGILRLKMFLEEHIPTFALTF